MAFTVAAAPVSVVIETRRASSIRRTVLSSKND